MKKLWIIGGIGVIILLAVGVWFWVIKKGTGKNNTGSNPPPISSTKPTTSPAISPDQLRKDAASLSDKINKVAAVDQDLDGLSDQDEKKYGTDPTSPDTDGDGLLDKDELRVYHTNPLNADTDGDGMLDGYEVDRRTDPLKAK